MSCGGTTRSWTLAAAASVTSTLLLDDRVACTQRDPITLRDEVAPGAVFGAGCRTAYLRF
ncbi:hypothetical protein ABZU76_38750 [Amycolatopsis sp. NPDC005232]|uniref:hypothetical protein n=1 Tax=Amycolatopsis sp. NPDC005232 TaxID=3157027 RepID=UPI0033A754CD